jgi:FKBP-type peptidyl-prolyl cis-trans isomerase FkpA
MKRKLLLPVLAALLFFSCKEQKIPGFRRLEDGSYFKLISLGESERKPKAGDYLDLVMYNTFADSVLFDSRLESPTGTILAPFSDKANYARLREGDSAVLLVPAYDLMEFANDSMMHMHVKLVRILNEKEWMLETEKRSHLDEFGEQKIISYFVKKQKKNYKKLPNGLYMLSQKEGSGKKIESGDRVLVNYRGMFLNGKKFDFTSEPIEFAIGEEGQLLEGVSLALSQMKEGGKAKFIIPSHLAYGGEGSSTGIVKPYTTLLYEIEVLKVN